MKFSENKVMKGRGANNQNGNLRWLFQLGVRPIAPPPLNGHNFQAFFTPFLSFAIESYIYETDFTLQTLPKAQRTRGLSSAYQSYLF